MKKKIEDLIKILQTFIQKLQHYRHLYKIKTRDEYGAFVKCTTSIKKHMARMKKYLKKIQKIIKRLEPIQSPKQTPISSSQNKTPPPSGINTPPSGINTPPHKHAALSKNKYYTPIYNPLGLSRSQSQQQVQ
jgi:hypothetical protein